MLIIYVEDGRHFVYETGRRVMVIGASGAQYAYTEDIKAGCWLFILGAGQRPNRRIDLAYITGATKT